jgi:preprotein translocase subunit SecE
MANKDREKDDDLERDDDSSSDEAEVSAEGRDERVEEESDESPRQSADESPEEHERRREIEQAEELAVEAKALEHASETVPAQLGSTRYVHAAFFAAGILVAFVSEKVLGAVWSALSDWPAATRAVPWLLRFAEDERNTYVLVAGALLGVLAVVQTYRKEKIRRWADEVALELSKVSWPTKDTVTNGTIVVIVASMIATVYVTLLDRFWGFLSHLVYGA